MLTKLLLIFEALLLVNVLGCATRKYKLQEIDGTYISKGNSSSRIVIARGKFVLFGPGGIHSAICCDTVTYGTVDLDGGILIFNSDPSLNSIFIDMEVKEERGPKTDSVVFFVQNPIEGTHRNNSKTRYLTYSLLVQPKASSSGYFKENFQLFDSSRIGFYNPEHLDIYNFKLTIIPRPDILGKSASVTEIHTLEYYVKDSKSNIFWIDIPRLNYEFVTFRRLNDDYARIINSDTILWDGEEFIRLAGDKRL